METPQQTLTEEVRQAKVYDLIEKFKERKKQSQEQLERDRNNSMI